MVVVQFESTKNPKGEKDSSLTRNDNKVSILSSRTLRLPLRVDSERDLGQTEPLPHSTHAL